jgi:cytochrome c553
MRHPTTWFSSFAILALMLFPEAVGTAGAKDKVVGPPEVAWKNMKYAQRKAYMKAVVMPKMREVFQAFDAKKFSTVDCATCHGRDFAERKYKMPGPDIHPLPGTPAAFMAKVKVEPTWPKFTKFMSEEVEPAMGKLLDVPVFNPKKPVEGAFGCGACHKIEGPAH